MKKIIIKLIAVNVFVLSFLTACKNAKEIANVTGAQEISVPFSEKKYKTDKDYFRASLNGKSPDLATAKKIAIQNAKSEMASSIKSVMKIVTDQYTNQRSLVDKQEFESKFEELSRNVVDQSLVNVDIMDEKIFKETNGSYTYWVVLQVSKQSLLESVNGKVSKNEKLQLDYDKKKFEEVFNDEMEKMSKQ